MNEVAYSKKEIEKYDDLFLILIIFGSIFAYTNFSTIGQTIRLLGQLGFIVSYSFRLDFSKYNFIFPIFFVFISYPLLLNSLGIYMLADQVLGYVLFFNWYLLSMIAIAEHYSNDVERLINLIYAVLIISMGGLFLFYRGISLDVVPLIRSIVLNQRYGGNIVTARVAMGFQNVNQLGLFASVLAVFSLFKLFHLKNVFFNFLIFLVSVIFILNSGSRTPLITITVFLVIYLIFNIKSRWTKLFFKIVFICFVFFVYFMFIYLLYYSNSGSNFFEIIDGFLSYRISFSQQALQLIEHFGTDLFGIGTMSSSFIQSNLLSGSLAIDSSLSYYLLTLGTIGSIGLGFAIIYLVYKLNNLNNAFVIGLFGFYICYSLFENVLFTPNSGLGIIVLSIVFAYLRKQNNHNLF